MINSRVFIRAALLLVLSLASAHAQAPAAPTPIVLRAARMLDVESGHLVRDARVVVQGDRIVAVNPASLPANARVVELGDATLLPGFIDAHTHLTGEIAPGYQYQAVTETEFDGAYHAVKHGRITLMAGFTTVRDFDGQASVALSRAVERGEVLAPRIISSRYPLGITGGHCDVTGFAPGILEQGEEDGIADGPWAAVRAVRYQIKHGAKVIKICATAGVLSLEGPVGAQQFSDEELKAIVDEASRHGVKVAAHAHGTEGIKAAVRAGVASIEHGSILDDEAIALMKARGTYLVPTAYLADRIDFDALPPLVRSKAEFVMPLARASLRKAIAEGVKIAFGTDAAVYPHGENAKEFAVYVRSGMSPLQALRSATTAAADLLGTTDRGVIAAGKLADVIAVPGNPLEDITATERVRFVMFDGQIVKNVEGTDR